MQYPLQILFNTVRGNDGYSIRAEARRYVYASRQGRAAMNLFFGLQTFYTHYSVVEKEPYYHTYFKSTLVEVTSIGIAPVAGFQNRLGKHFVYEMYIGFGYKRKFTNGFVSGPLGIGDPFYKDQPSYSSLAVPLSISIGYYF